MIEVQKLSRQYGSLTAVDSISFKIPQGEIVGLLGHNGAGKTTTLKMLTGYLEPSSGKVSVAGCDIEVDPIAVQQKIGYLSELSPLYPDMSVWEYLYYVAEMRGIEATAISAAIRDAVAATDLASKAQELISTLSRGYKQRVGVAQAIIHKPEILILDEPTNGLDPTQILAMRRLIKSLARHSTVILSTHIMQEVEAICDRVIIILNGRIAVDSSLADLRHNNNITLSVDAEQARVRNVLGSCSEITAIEPVSSGGGKCEYLIKVDGNIEETAPMIARKAIEEGWKLYNLNSETRDLESIFNEVNRVRGDSPHA